MSAEAGPGPSSMGSSPVVPSSAKQMRVKKRVINIVNPADPESFSVDNISFERSFSPQAPVIDTVVRTTREETPVREASPHTPMMSTPLGSEMAKRGILRPSGTPGSGNGVRFFPKNKFRIITPNHSLHQPASPATASAKGTPERRRQSLLTQLLSAAMPSVSPVKQDEDEQQEEMGNESWEVPGQEGEVSLIASSNTSMIINDDEDEDEEDKDYVEAATPVWDGTPMVHSSPLNLPLTQDDSRDISQHDLEPEQLSTEWAIQVPDDMSNLLNEKWSPTDPSFSISEPPPTSASGTPSSNRMPLPTRYRSASPSVPPQSEPPAGQTDSTITVEEQTSDVGATVRKASPTIHHLSPLVPLEPATPTPAAKPMRSIFADMSGDQSETSPWSARRDQITSHSTIMPADGDASEAASPLPSPLTAVAPPITPRSADRTTYFDCADSTFTFSPLPPIVSPTPAAGPVSRLSPDLAQPTKDLFAAQSAHAQALIAEVQLYRDLASKLHNEVMERDAVLAELNGRVLEQEVLRSEVDSLRSELVKLKAGPDSLSSSSRARNAGPSNKVALPSTSPDAADRTTIVQAEKRDLEIRLSKALSEQASLRREIDTVNAQRKNDQAELAEARRGMQEAEDRHRDQLIAAQQSSRPDAPATEELERALDRCSELEVQLTRLSEDHGSLQDQMTDMRQVKAGDEEEIDRLNAALDGMRQSRRDTEGVWTQLEETERRLEAESRRRTELEEMMHAEREARRRVEAENKELLKSLQTTRQQLAQTPSNDGEIARLRSESATKDLEISNLHRRKAELKEDREMLNIALDSKQQELELIKRKYGIKGVAGSTPLGISTRANETPLPRSLRPGGEGGGKSRRRSSALHPHDFITPSLVNGDKRALRSAALLNSTNVPDHNIKMGAGQENAVPASSGRYASLRRERMMA